MGLLQAVANAAASRACRGIIFDFDGTLVDLPVRWATLRTQIREECAILGDLRINDMFTVIRERADARVLQRARALVAQFEGEAVAHAVVRPHVRECLAWCHERGLRLGICSNNMGSTIRSVISCEQWLPWFSSIVGKDDVMRPKPDPEGLRRILSQWDFRAQEVVYVGNEEQDAVCGAAAGTPTIIIT